jgi:hypothetical protein
MNRTLTILVRSHLHPSQHITVAQELRVETQPCLNLHVAYQVSTLRTPIG